MRSVLVRSVAARGEVASSSLDVRPARPGAAGPSSGHDGAVLSCRPRASIARPGWCCSRRRAYLCELPRCAPMPTLARAGDRRRSAAVLRQRAAIQGARPQAGERLPSLPPITRLGGRASSSPTEHASAGTAQRYVRLAQTRRKTRTWQLNTGAAAMRTRYGPGVSIPTTDGAEIEASGRQQSQLRRLGEERALHDRFAVSEGRIRRAHRPSTRTGPAAQAPAIASCSSRPAPRRTCVTRPVGGRHRHHHVVGRDPEPQQLAADALGGRLWGPARQHQQPHLERGPSDHRRLAHAGPRLGRAGGPAVRRRPSHQHHGRDRHRQLASLPGFGSQFTGSSEALDETYVAVLRRVWRRRG